MAVKQKQLVKKDLYV